MNKWHKLTEQILLDNELQELENLKKAYTDSLVKVKKRVRTLLSEIDILKQEGANDSEIQAKIYQLNFQKSLEEQINNAMKILSDDNIQDMNAYLMKMYEDGYITQQFIINKYGIPVITPINQRLLIQAVNTKVDGFKFSQRLYDNIQELGQQTINAISDGIIRGKGYKEIAKVISDYSEASLKQSYTIARTEGRRVSNKAKYDSQMDAKRNGADIVKQWDSTLDGKTRPEHRGLDGQVKEIEEDYEFEGMKAKEPTMFGIPYMDINCRCVSLTIPRWALKKAYPKRDGLVTESVLKMAYKTAQQNGTLSQALENQYGLANELKEVENYYDWKDRYYKGAIF